MSNWRKRTCLRRGAAFVLFGLLLAVAWGGKPASSSAQTIGDTPIAGIRPTLQAVPRTEPRPAGEFRTEREGDEQKPTASFLDTLKGGDAAVEIIVGQGRLLTTKVDIATEEGTGVIAVGDPTVIDFEVLPNPRMIRVVGRRAGVTDLSITTSNDETYTFEIHVVYDLDLLRAQLRQVFPDAFLKLGQIREHLVVEGQARSPAQVSRIVQTIQAYLQSVQVAQSASGQRGGQGPGQGPPGGQYGNGQGTPEEGGAEPGEEPQRRAEAGEEQRGDTRTQATFAPPQVINLIRVPGVNQVMLQVRVAELNRTGLREIGADILGVDPSTGTILGTQIAGSTITALGTLGLGGLLGEAGGQLGSNATGFGIFPTSDFMILLKALRQNQLVTILAEPNLTTMSGHEASFLAGGEFPVPVPQGGGIQNNVTVEWKEFGVQLGFVPYVLEDGTIRLTVRPEVSTIDFRLGTTLVVGGDPVPGVNTRRANTTVEMRQGQSLAIAGLLNVEIEGETDRIPGLGDLPYIGPMFSNTSHEKREKELLVIVTPHLVSPMKCDQVPSLPGEEVYTPNDLEFYLLNRIEGRTGRDFRATMSWQDPMDLVNLMHLEQRKICGPVGYSE